MVSLRECRDLASSARNGGASIRRTAADRSAAVASQDGRDRAGRELLHHHQRLGAELPGPGNRPAGHRGGHQRPFPNSTSRLSGR